MNAEVTQTAMDWI